MKKDEFWTMVGGAVCVAVVFGTMCFSMFLDYKLKTNSAVMELAVCKKASAK